MGMFVERHGFPWKYALFRELNAFWAGRRSLPGAVDSHLPEANQPMTLFGFEGEVPKGEHFVFLGPPKRQ